MRLFKWPQFVFKQTATELSAWRKTVSTFNGRALLAFVALYLLALADCRHSLARDPTSLFFDPIESYRPQYSSVRREQALNYVAHGGHPNLEHAAKLPTTCVGIATFKRPGEQYVKAAIGSLLEGLRDHERRDVYFLILIANTDPLEHPIYGERDDPDWEHLRLLETSQLFREKTVHDYTFLLEQCYRTGASIIAMFEDDIIALRGWYARMLKALSDVEDRDARSNWLYLRLFYTEEFLGWNLEEWPRYLIWSISLVLGTFVALSSVQRLYSLHTQIPNRFIAVLSGMCAPACIVLYFVAGRVSMQPVLPGVFQMPRYGCCSQGLVFNRMLVPDTVDWLRKAKVGQIDSLLEEWADLKGLPRWAVSPSLLQHVGAKSSRGDDYGSKSKHNMTVAAKIWNFQFEQSTPFELERLEVEATNDDHSYWGGGEKTKLA